MNTTSHFTGRCSICKVDDLPLPVLYNEALICARCDNKLRGLPEDTPHAEIRTIELNDAGFLE